LKVNVTVVGRTKKKKRKKCTRYFDVAFVAMLGRQQYHFDQGQDDSLKRRISLPGAKIIMSGTKHYFRRLYRAHFCF